MVIGGKRERWLSKEGRFTVISISLNPTQRPKRAKNDAGPHPNEGSNRQGNPDPPNEVEGEEVSTRAPTRGPTTVQHVASQNMGITL